MLLNGVPGKTFECRRGVRQGDPLSPLLFVLAADLLQSVVNKANSLGVLKHPLGDSFEGDYPIVQYADDTLLIMPADARQLMALKALLHTFSESRGLKVNYAKSHMVLINMTPERADLLANTLGCAIADMPFTYLGLPLGITKSTVDEFLPMLNRIERRMMGLNKLLHYSGRLILVNSVLSALPTFYMCTLPVPVSIIEQIDKYRMHYLWDNGDIDKRGGCLVAWKEVTRPKDQGGLGIIDLRAHNTALLLKYLHKFYNKQDLPWVNLTWKHLYRNQNKAPHEYRPKGSFWWRSIIRLADKYFMMAKCDVQEGTTASFWTSPWNLGILKTMYPQLHSFSISKHITVKGSLSNTVDMNFRLPLSLQASAQLTLLQEQLKEIHLLPGHCDKWSYIWGSGNFTCKKAYLQLIGFLEASPWFKWLWNSQCRGKHRFFFWLLLKDRLNTRYYQKKKHAP